MMMCDSVSISKSGMQYPLAITRDGGCDKSSQLAGGRQYRASGADFRLSILKLTAPGVNAGGGNRPGAPELNDSHPRSWLKQQPPRRPPRFLDQWWLCPNTSRNPRY